VWHLVGQLIQHQNHFNRHSASQEIPCILWNPKVLFRIYTRPPPVPILNQNNPVHASPSHFLNIHFNVILPSNPRSSKCLSPSGLPDRNLVCTSPFPHTCYIPCTFLSFWLCLYNNIWWGLQIITFLVMSSSPLPYYLVTLRPKYLPRRPFLEHPQPIFLRLCEKQVSFPYVRYDNRVKVFSLSSNHSTRYSISWYAGWLGV
jgi:hypothetical protein